MPLKQLEILADFAEVAEIAWLCFFSRLAIVRGRIGAARGAKLLVVGVTATKGLFDGFEPWPMQNLALFASKWLLANSRLWPVDNLTSLASREQHVPIMVTYSLYWISLQG